MHRKNRHPSTGFADAGRHLHAVADGRDQQEAPSAEDKVREALTRHPGSTAAAVAKAAEVGRSTAGKILARWGGDGTAIRTTGDGPRDPDTWSLAAPDHDTVSPDADGAETAAATPPSVDDTTEHASDAADNTATEAPATAQDADPDGQKAEDAAATQDAAAEPEPDRTPEAPANATDEEAPAPSDAESTEPPPATEPLADNADEAEPSPSAAPAVSGTTGSVRSDNGRLSKGALRALVEEYLTDHPGESFGPAQIGKDLGRSGGAVNNACEKLVADGYAIKTCEAPKRFTINPDKTDVLATTENATPAG